MTPRLRKFTVALLMVPALTLAGCSGANNDAKSTHAGGQEIVADGAMNLQDRDKLQDGGELRLAIAELPEQNNKFHANTTGNASRLWAWYNPELALYDGDGTFHANPAYITDIKDEVVDGKTQVTYTINEQAQYNDGTPLDWKSFENTWKFNNGTYPDVSVSNTSGYDLIESVERGNNDKEAVVTFKQPYAWWQALFNSLVPPQVDTADKFNNAYLQNLKPEWGAGPFTVEKVDFNTGTVSFVRNDKWWGEPAKLDRVSYRQMESQASLNAFKAGEIDTVVVSNKERLATAKSMGDKVDLRTALDPANVLLILNGRGPILEDKEVRKAIFTGIDRSQLAAIRFNGLDYTEDLPGSFLLFQGQEGYEDNFGAVVSYDPEEAKKILDEAGWVVGADGIREKDGQRLDIRYVIVGNNESVKATAGALQKMLKDIGVNLEIVERPSSDFSNIMKNNDFDLFALRFVSEDPFGVASFKQYYASDSQLNRSGTGTVELDAKIAKLEEIADMDEQIEEANKLEKEAFQQYGIMPYANGPVIAATPPKLANYGSPFFAVLPKENIGWMK